MPIYNPGDYSVTQITSADTLSVSADNTPHNDLKTVLDVLSNHHNNNLIQNGNLNLLGDLYVAGAMSVINTTTLSINDSNITLNDGGGAKGTAGLLMTSSGGDLAVLELSVGDETWHAGSAPLSSTNQIPLLNSDRSLTLPATGIGDSAISMDLAYALIAPGLSGTSTSITELSQAINVGPSGISGDIILSLEELNDSMWIQNVWQAASTISQARTMFAGAGTQNNAIVFGGNTSASNYATHVATCDRYNGNTWLAVGSLNAAKTDHQGAGVYNAALSFCGTTGTGVTNIFEKWDGSTWTSTSPGGVGSASKSGGCGKRNAAISVGGTSGSPFANAYRFNGATWSPQVVLTRYNNIKQQ
jgi:hypothetical protein